MPTNYFLKRPNVKIKPFHPRMILFIYNKLPVFKVHEICICIHTLTNCLKLGLFELAIGFCINDKQILYY